MSVMTNTAALDAADAGESSLAGTSLIGRSAKWSLGLRMLQRDSVVLTDSQGRRVRFLGTVRWSDFDLFGEAGRAIGRTLRQDVERARIEHLEQHLALRDLLAGIAQPLRDCLRAERLGRSIFPLSKAERMAGQRPRPYDV